MKKYKFAKLKLSDSDRKWLGKIYSYDFKILDDKTVRVSLANELEKGFDHKKIDYRLLRDNRLTLIGIWYVDEKSKYFDILPRIVFLLKDIIKCTDFSFKVCVKDIYGKLDASESEISIALMLLWDLGFFSGGSLIRNSGLDDANISNSNGGLDKILYFENIYEEMETYFIKYSPLKISNTPTKITSNNKSRSENDNIWMKINKDFSLTKKEFGKRINFIEHVITRKIIFRDIEHAYILLREGFYKSSVILAGGVMEEILRQLLTLKEEVAENINFNELIKKCSHKGLLSTPRNQLTESARYFRNVVHINNEVKQNNKITKAIAHSAFSAIFILVDRLEK